MTLPSQRSRVCSPARRIAPLVALGTTLVTAPVVADPAVEASAFPVERFRAAIDRAGILGAEWADVPAHLSWDVGFWLGVSDDALVTYDAAGDRALALVHRRTTGTATAALALWDGLQLGVEVPVILAQSRDRDQGGYLLGDISGASLGDVRLVPKLGVLRQARDGVALALLPAITLPTGGSDQYRGEASVTFAPELAVSRASDRVRVTANLGYRLRRGTALSDLAVDDEVFARVAAGLHATAALDVEVGLATATAAADPYGTANRDHLQALAGITYDVPGPLAIGAVAGAGLANGFGTPDWVGALTVRVDGARPPSTAGARTQLVRR